MKSKTIPFILIALNLAAPSLSYSQTKAISSQNTVPEIPDDSVSYAEEVSQKLWSDFTSALKNTKLKSTTNLPTFKMSKGLSSEMGYGFESSPSIAGKYSGIDVWEINLSAYSQIFGLPSKLGVGASAATQFTFIQQFENRSSSLRRIPYDPITKLPFKSDLFSKTVYNSTKNKNEPLIKEGDFIGFRAPLTFSIGSGASFPLIAHLSLDADVRWILSGEFSIHIFKMANNQVRVKLISIDDDVRVGNLGINLMGFNRVGKMITSRIIDDYIIQSSVSEKFSDLIIADYIFNLNQPEAHDMYDQLIGHKMKVFDPEAFSLQIKNSNPITKGDSKKQYLLADLDRLNMASTEDQDKPISNRRVIRVSNGENRTNSLSYGLNLNILKAVRVSNEHTKSTSYATIYSQDNHSTKDKYILEATAKNFSYEWFWVWGEKNTTTTSLLLKSDDHFKPTNLLGFQVAKTKEDKSMSLTEYSTIKNAFTRILPKPLSNVIGWPNWNFGHKHTVNNVYINQEILFTDQLFKSDLNVSEEEIKRALVLILKNYGPIHAKPMGLSDDASTNILNKDLRREAYDKGDNINAFAADFEQTIIPRFLAVVLNSKKMDGSENHIADRYAAYQYLNKSIPLFAEINAVLLLRLIPEKDLPNKVIGKLSMSAIDQVPVDAYYPDKATYFKSNVFREISYQTRYILNRSFDLRNFIKEDGSLYSTEEILLQRTAK